MAYEEMSKLENYIQCLHFLRHYSRHVSPPDILEITWPARDGHLPNLTANGVTYSAHRISGLLWNLKIPKFIKKKFQETNKKCQKKGQVWCSGTALGEEWILLAVNESIRQQINSSCKANYMTKGLSGFSSSSDISVTKTRMMIWADHAACMKNKNEYTVPVAKSESKKRLVKA